MSERGFEVVATLADLAPGRLHPATLADGTTVVVFRVGDGIHALRDQCSHRRFPLSAGTLGDDGTVECAWHGARFCPRTGVELVGPGGGDVEVFDVRVTGETVAVRPAAGASR
jgi:3-phenylpropionate/trans-cinnamate dioxygenase ferredoxin subunit